MCNDSFDFPGNLVEEMSGPASGYQKVIQENRKLYNMAQDLKGEFGLEGMLEFFFSPRVFPMWATMSVSIVCISGILLKN